MGLKDKMSAPRGNRGELRGNHGERGFVLITVAIAAIALIVCLGLAVDVGRLFISKNEVQAFTDAAALAAALQLDGTTTGITAAQTAVSSSTNKWNMDTTSVSSPTVTFATSSAGPWVASPSPATNYTYVKVSATVAQQLYFMPVMVTQTTQNVVASATAAQVPITSFPRGLAPFTAVSTNTTGPYFGLTVGGSYDIQWPQFNNTRAGCGPGNPAKCFNQSPCADDSKASQTAVVNAWGSDNSGYWGSTSNSSIEQEVLDLLQLAPVSVGTDIQPVLSNGTKASEAGYLDERASQDVNTTDNVVGTYLSSVHNGRRLIAVPVVNPSVDAAGNKTTTVSGYGQFLLMANGPGTTNYYTRNTNGNDPFCALYVGPYNIGSSNPGAGGSTGASRVKLVQ